MYEAHIQQFDYVLLRKSSHIDSKADDIHEIFSKKKKENPFHDLAFQFLKSEFPLFLPYPRK